ncbi:M55 family metallopeptidase [candidate division KSB1 bacterium]|nr:M55 family metallopeptidase [candidate division KSB1 bacterium]
MSQQALKVYISVDMEGITDVAHWDEVFEKNPDYPYFRKLMTGEANAAIEGAFAAGATEVVVRDAHGSGRNLIPDELNENARLIREWSGGPMGMLEQIDRTYHAVLCVGYHAKASTPNAILKHTMTGNVLDLRVNGVSVPELGWNGMIAAYYGVPIVFVAGDQAICNQAKQLFPKIETVVVKEAFGSACINLHPKRSRALIRAGVEKALAELATYQPLQLKPPFLVELFFKDENKAYRASWYPGAKRIEALGVALECQDFLDGLRFFKICS